ncbi:MAG: hypothetical protein ACOYIC_04110 [Butyricicoccus sp.]
MALFEMIQYHAYTYPDDIPLKMKEIPAHFDVAGIAIDGPCSLHTEYSYGKRALDSKVIEKFPVLLESHKNRVPQLWKSKEWAVSFAEFIFELVPQVDLLKIIEIHPPFSDYTDIGCFLDTYEVFEQIVLSRYPKTEIIIENRCGSTYRGGRFIVSKQRDMEKLCEIVEEKGLKLRVALDIPQLYTAEKVKKDEEYFEILDNLKQIKSYVKSIHLWGKKKSKNGRTVAHIGDLNSYFNGNLLIKDAFLKEFLQCFTDEIVRKMVLEVNSNNADLISIIQDLKQFGAEFI